jgi:hypothetical protein
VLLEARSPETDELERGHSSFKTVLLSPVQTLIYRAILNESHVRQFPNKIPRWYTRADAPYQQTILLLI